MESFSVDVEFILIGFHDFKYLVIVICEVTNFVLAIQVKSRAAQGVAENINSQLYAFWSTQTPHSRQIFCIYKRAQSVHIENYELPFKK